VYSCSEKKNQGRFRLVGSDHSLVSSIVGTMLQAGRTPVRVPDEVDFFGLPKPSSHTMALGSTRSLTETSTRNLPESKGRPTRKADNLTATCERFRKCGSLDVSQPYRPPEPVTGIALIFLHTHTHRTYV
jgi:hypothetical protein